MCSALIIEFFLASLGTESVGRAESDEPLALHVDVLLPRVEVPLLVFKLFLEVRLERAFEVLCEDFLVQFEGMFNLSDVLEVDSVGDSEALHLVGVAPLLEMLLEGTAAPVARPTTNLTLELLAEAVQFEQPIRNRFSVPAHRQVLRVVLNPVFVVV